MSVPVLASIAALFLITAWALARSPRVRPTSVEVVSETLLLALVVTGLVAGVAAAVGRPVTPVWALGGALLFAFGAAGALVTRASRDPRGRRIGLREALLPSSQDGTAGLVFGAAALTFAVHFLAFDPIVAERAPLARAAYELAGGLPRSAVPVPAPAGAVAMTAVPVGLFGSFGLAWLSAALPALFVLFGSRVGKALTGSTGAATLGALVVANTPVVLAPPTPSPALFAAVLLVAGLALFLDLDSPRVGQPPVPDASPLPVHTSVGDMAASAALGALALGAAVACYPPALPMVAAIVVIAALTRAPEAPTVAFLVGLGVAMALVGGAPLLLVSSPAATAPSGPALSLGLPNILRGLLEMIANVGTGLVAISTIGLFSLITTPKRRVPLALLVGFAGVAGLGWFLGRAPEAIAAESALLVAPLGAAGMAAGFVAVLEWRMAIALGLVMAALTVGVLTSARLFQVSDPAPLPAAIAAFERQRLTGARPWPALDWSRGPSLGERLGLVWGAARGQAPMLVVSPMMTAPVDIALDLAAPLPFAGGPSLGPASDPTAVDATEDVALRLVVPSHPDEGIWLVRTASDELRLVMSGSTPPRIDRVVEGARQAPTWGAVRIPRGVLTLRVRAGDRLEIRTDAPGVPGLEYVRRVRIESGRLSADPVVREGPG